MMNKTNICFIKFFFINVNISYSCMPYIGNIIKSHNASILNPDKAQENVKECSCRNKDSCPLDNNCLTKSLIYQANLSCDNDENFKYIGGRPS